MSDKAGSDELFSTQADRALRRLPLAELVARSDEQVRQADLFRRAARSSLYGRRWQAAGVNLDHVAGRAGLRRLPFLAGADLLALNESGRHLQAALLTRPRVWVASHGAAGAAAGARGAPAPAAAKKWLPLTLGDVAHWLARVGRLYDLLGIAAAPPATALVINEPMPQVSNAVPYLLERLDYLVGGRRLEFIIAALAMLPRNHWERFAARKGVGWLMGSVRDGLALAQVLQADGLALTAPKGLFWGAAPDDRDAARAELAAAFGVKEAFSVYFSAECREMYAECPAHDGLHLWMDDVIHEIIPEGGQPADAVFVDQAPLGLAGEYVVTTFAEALPLIRYRTGDRVRVVSTAACACGITHPRVAFIGRI